MTEFNAAILYFFLMILSGLNTSADNQVSLDVQEKLLQVKSMDDFRRLFKVDDSNDIYKRGGNANVPFAEPGDCEPRLAVHQIPNPTPSLPYYPPCIMIHRCSGCSSPITTYQCEVATTQTASVKVYKFMAATSVSEVIYDYVNHTSCRAACRTKPTDCVGKQVFDPSNCQCACNVPEESRKCPEKKQWSNIQCDCVCKDDNCPSGTKLNKETCICDPINDEEFIENQWLVDAGFEK